MIPESLFSSQGATLIGFAFLGLIVLAGAFLVLRQFKSDLAKELKAQLQQNDEAQQVAIQQPLETRQVVRMATHEELKIIEGRVERLEHQDAERLQMLTKALAKLDEKSEERASHTHERINLLLSGISRVEGELKRLPCTLGKPCIP
jgi:succinylglutamate desuccinylase